MMHIWLSFAIFFIIIAVSCSSILAHSDNNNSNSIINIDLNALETSSCTDIYCKYLATNHNIGFIPRNIIHLNCGNGDALFKFKNSLPETAVNIDIYGVDSSDTQIITAKTTQQNSLMTSTSASTTTTSDSSNSKRVHFITSKAYENEKLMCRNRTWDILWITFGSEIQSDNFSYNYNMIHSSGNNFHNFITQLKLCVVHMAVLEYIFPDYYSETQKTSIMNVFKLKLSNYKSLIQYKFNITFEF